MPMTPVVERLRQEHSEFEALADDIVSSRPT